jgi:hypothetical protein
MAARSPRKIFASPFVVTLAAIPACFTESSPPPQQPQQPPTTQVEPQPQPPSGGGTAQTYGFDQRWLVSKQGTGCQAMARTECPKPKNPGDQVPTCNPPPPMKVTCPENWDGKEAITIVMYANQANCFIEPAPVKCPPNVACNPPPPRKVACPTFQ